MAQSPCCVWEIRANLDMYEDIEEFKKAWRGLAKQWVVQTERGSGGYEHWQGRVSLIKKKRKSELMALLKESDHPVPNYLEPTTNAEHKKAAFYCVKEDSRIDGPWSDKDKEIYIPRQLRHLDEYPWQRQVRESSDVFDARGVDVIIDKGGCSGKSTIARICQLKCRAIKLPIHNDGIKLIQSTCNMLMARQERQPSHVFVDMPRAFGKERLGGLYTAIEEIKGGYVYDERNHFQEWWFDSPRVWVFTNDVPDFSYLSEDRWRCWTISDKKELVRYQGGELSDDDEPQDHRTVSFN